MIEYNPYAPDIQYNPYPCWQRLRDEAPVYFNPELNFYALTRYDDVLAAFLDAKTFISGQGVTIGEFNKGSGALIETDDPEHAAYRKLLSRVFTPRRVGDLEPFIRRVAAQHLDGVRGQERFDVIQDFSLRLPLEVIGELLGIPTELRQIIHDLMNRSATRDADAEKALAAEDAHVAMEELKVLFLELVADRRRNPGDDIISMLISSEVTDEDGKVQPISDEIVAAQFVLLAGAGHETVMKSIGNGAVALWWYPEQRAELVHDPSLIPGAVEEILRWDNPAPLEGRWTTRDVELHGTTIPKDSRVMLIQGAANHDDRQYEHPELFDIHRKITRPLIFGFGAHLCLGAALARLEMRVAFGELLARFPEYEIDEPNVERGAITFFRGLKNLPVSPGR
jgi:cytochrome P450